MSLGVPPRPLSNKVPMEPPATGLSISILRVASLLSVRPLLLAPQVRLGFSRPWGHYSLSHKNKCAMEAHLLNTAWGTLPRDSLFQNKWHRKLYSFMCQLRMYLEFLRGKVDSTTNLH